MVRVRCESLRSGQRCLTDLCRERFVNVEQMRHHPFADDGRLHLAQLESQGGGDVVLLTLGLADEKLPCLAVVIGKAFRPQPPLGPILYIRKRHEAAIG